MAVLFMTGFEEYANPSTYYLKPGGTGLGTSTSFRVTSGEGRFGDTALNNAQAGGGEKYDPCFMLSPVSFGNFNTLGGYTVVMGFAYKFSAAGLQNNIIEWWDRYLDGTDILISRIGMTADNILFIENSGVQRLGTVPLFTNRYYYLEWKLTIKGHVNTAGNQFILDQCGSNTNVLRVDGANEVVMPSTTLMGEVSKDGKYIDAGGIQVPYIQKPSQPYLLYHVFNNRNWYDDLYILDSSGASNNDFLGDCKISFLQAEATGVPTTGNDSWTNVGGANKNASLREVEPDQDTSYVASTTAGNIQTVQFPDMRTNSTTVFCVQTNAVVRKTDSGTRTFSYILGTAESTPPVQLNNDFYLRLVQCFDTNPQTSVAWTSTAINSLEAGVKLVT